MITTLHVYPNGDRLLEPFLSPFETGKPVVIPKGTWIVRMGRKDSARSARRVVVEPAGVSDGYLVHGYQVRSVHPLVHKLPEIRWAGSGGYWAYAQVNSAVLEANGLSLSGLTPNERSLEAHRHDIQRLARSTV